MPTLIDSYAESNYNGSASLGSNGAKNVSQSFTNTNAVFLDSVKLYLKKVGSPTGNASVTIYAHTGTYGTSSKLTGSVLATANLLDVSKLTTSFALVTFHFSGANRISLTAATYYVLILGYSGGDSSNYVSWGQDTSSPTHSGNKAQNLSGSTWTTVSGTDMIFYIYSGDKYYLYCENSAYAVAGQNLTGALATRLLRLSGSADWAVAGVDVALTKGLGLTHYTLTSDVSDWSVAGQNLTSLLPGRKCIASSASLSLEGPSANILSDRILSTGSQDWESSGQTGFVKAGRILNSEQGSWLLTDYDPDVKADRKLYAVSSAVDLQQQDSMAKATRLLSADVADWDITFTQADISLKHYYSLVPVSDTILISGQLASFSATRRLQTADVSWSISGQSNRTTAQRQLNASRARFDITSVTSGLGKTLIFQARTTNYSVSGQVMNTITRRKLQASKSGWLITSQPAALSKSRILFAGPVQWTVLPKTSGLFKGFLCHTSSGSMIASVQPVYLIADRYFPLQSVSITVSYRTARILPVKFPTSYHYGYSIITLTHEGVSPLILQHVGVGSITADDLQDSLLTLTHRGIGQMTILHDEPNKLL